MEEGEAELSLAETVGMHEIFELCAVLGEELLVELSVVAVLPAGIILHHRVVQLRGRCAVGSSVVSIGVHHVQLAARESARGANLEEDDATPFPKATLVPSGTR